MRLWSFKIPKIILYINTGCYYIYNMKVMWTTYCSRLNGVTISGNVRFCAIDLGTPTWSIWRLGSGVMTVRAEKSTRFPIKFPRIRPSFPLRRALIAFNGFPDFCMALGMPGISLSTKVATWNCNILTFSDKTWAAAPAISLRASSLLDLMMSASLWVKSS